MIKKTLLISIISTLCFSFYAGAQDTCKVEFSTGADIVSRYVWRGIDFGNAPAVQPTLEANYKNFAIGAWGSQSISSNTGGLETDLYATYTFDFGLSLGISDYYFPGEMLAAINNYPDTATSIIVPVRSGNYFDFENAHFLETNVNYEIKNFNFSANYLFHNASDDMYFEIGYNYKNVNIFIGGGNEGYTSDGNFNVCNVGFSVSKEVKISNDYKLPLNGALILNPDSEQIHLVFGVSL